nr:S4 domain-containing protein [Chloracidobacterium aggregatum]
MDAAPSTVSALDLSAAETVLCRVPETAAGLRLDVFLAEVLSVSRARIQRAIADGEVRVNGQVRRASYRVEPGDDIEADVPAPVTTDLVPEDLPLTIRFEDEAILVLEKPAGQVVHPAAGVTHGTLANALAFHFGQQRPGRSRCVRELYTGSTGILRA